MCLTVCVSFKSLPFLFHEKPSDLVCRVAPLRVPTQVQSPARWRAPSREACARGPGQALPPGPSTGTHTQHFPHPALSPPAVGDEPMQPSGESGGESSVPGSSPSTLSGGSSAGAGGEEGHAAVRWDPRRCLSGGDGTTKGSLSSAYPGRRCIVPPPQKGTMGHCAEQKRGPCPASSSRGSGLPPRVCPGWARPPESSSWSSCSHVPSRVLLPELTTEVQSVRESRTSMGMNAVEQDLAGERPARVKFSPVSTWI